MARAMSRVVLAMALLWLTGCPSFSVRRSALVPHAAPTMRTGQPTAGSAELGLSTPRLVSLGQPSEGDGANAGLYLPRTQGGAELRIPTPRMPDVDLDVHYEYGFLRGATPITADQPRPRGGGVYGAGGSAYWAPRVGRDFRIGFGAGVTVYSIPFIEYRTCVDGCGAVPVNDIEEGRRKVLVLSSSITPSFKVGRVNVFASMTARNHPTNTKGEVTTDPYFDDSDEIRSGPMILIAAAGAEIDLGPLRAMANVFLPLDDSVVNYVPTIGMGISIPLGSPGPGALARP